MESIWQRLAAPVPAGTIEWRQQSKPKNQSGRFFAMFVAYIEAGTVRERLDDVVPGAWSLELTPLPRIEQVGASGQLVPDDPDAIVSFKARLTIAVTMPNGDTRDIYRECVGVGKDYKQASTDAFKRVAVRFGIANELYTMPLLWLEVDSDSKYAKPIEDPAVAYARKIGGAPPADRGGVSTPTTRAVSATVAEGLPACPKCSGNMWDNRAENVARRAKGEKERPDFKCRSRTCDGVIWPPKDAQQHDAFAESPPAGGVSTTRTFPKQVDPLTTPEQRRATEPVPIDDGRSVFAGYDDDDDLPF